MNRNSFFRTEMAKFERQLINEALEANGWNRTKTAQNLGISYRGLLYRIERMGLFSPNERARIERNARHLGIPTAATSTGDGGPGPGSHSLNAHAS
jgi:AraC-like DNA-binding protein